MSRLERHKNKQLIFTIAFYSIALVAILYLVFSFGMKLLLNASMFIANFNSKQTTESQVQDEDFFGSINIDSVPTATNSAQIIIGGSVLNYDTVIFYINGDKVKEKSFKSSETFSEKIGDLKKGENEVFVIAKSKEKKKQKKSEDFKVILKTDKPKLEINEPQDNTRTNKYEIKIAGKTDKETTVKVNNFPVVVNAEGAFDTLYKLKEGENKIEITSEDDAANIEKKTLTVIYQKDD